MQFEQLIIHAKAVLGSRQTSENVWVGSVAAAIVSESGKVYTGICIDMPCGMGFCAEHAAAAAMVTAGESRIMKCVAVGKNGVLPPCGRCREFMRQLDERNADAEILVRDGVVMRLADLLPEAW